MKKGGRQFLEIEEEFAGQRLDNFLLRRLKTIPKSHIYKLLRTGDVRVNGKRVRPEYKVQSADMVKLPPSLSQDLVGGTMGCGNGSGDGDDEVGRYNHGKRGNRGLRGRVAAPTVNAMQFLLQRIIYEDDKLIVLDKPAGMAAHGGSGVNFGVIETMRHARPELHYLELVHRLDRGTSGCMLLAKRRSMLRELHQLLREGRVNKRYLLLVRGQWHGGERRVDAPLLKNQFFSGERVVKVNDDIGKMATTIFKPRAIFKEASLLEAQIHTGKTHQIRVHAAHLGFPLAGDEKYGDKEFNRWIYALGLRRLFLHATALQFFLPMEGVGGEQEDKPEDERQSNRASYKLGRGHGRELSPGPGHSGGMAKVKQEAKAQGMPFSFTAPLPEELNNILKKL
jgi:23S rRNA pseudouridine955/2504/2580 synthase